MRTDCDHLPKSAHNELRAMQQVLFAEFEDALADYNAPQREAGQILKIILFGSYAQGDGEADPSLASLVGF